MKLEEGTEGPAAPDRFACPVQTVHRGDSFIQQYILTLGSFTTLQPWRSQRPLYHRNP